MSYDSTILADSPVSYWTLADPTGTTAADTGDSNPGTYNGTFTLAQAATGNLDGGVLLNGTNAYAEVPAASNLRPSAAVSVEGWVNLTASPRSNSFGHILESSWSSDVQPFSSYGIGTEGSGGCFYGNLSVGAGNLLNLNSTTIPAAGQWYYIAQTYDGITQKLYVNGVLEASGAVTGSIRYPGTPQTVSIGRKHRGATTGEYLKGTVSSVAVYSSALTLAQIQAHYLAGVGTFTLGTLAKPTSPVLQSAWSTAILAAYNLGEGSSTAADLSGNTHTGTLTGGCTWSSGSYGNHLALADNGTTGSYLALGNLASLASVTEWTFSALCQLNTLTDAPRASNIRFLIGTSRASASAPQSAIWYNATTQSIHFNVRYGNFTDIVAPAPPLNQWVLITGRVTAAHEASLWYDGVKVATVTNASYAFTGDATPIGSLGDYYGTQPGNNWSGPIAMGLFATRGYTDAEIIALAADPFVWDRTLGGPHRLAGIGGGLAGPYAHLAGNM